MATMKHALGVLALAMTLGACGDGDATCAPGTVLQDGQCIAAGVDVSGGTDTSTGGNDTSTGGSDTSPGGNDTSTGPNDTSTVGPDVSGECTPEEAGQRDFGAACSKSCQCREDVGGYCYNGPFLEGFSFCSRVGGLSGTLNSEQYPTLLFNSACWDFPPAQWKTPMTKTCATLEDCQALSPAYTHCGTQELDWHTGPASTLCPNRANSADPQGSTTMTAKKVCIIDTLPPFDRR